MIGIDYIKNLLIAVIPFVSLCLVLNKTNLPKESRHKQLLFPVCGVVYAFLLMWSVNHVSQGILSLLNKIPKWMGILSFLSPKISVIVQKVIREMDPEYWVVYYSNTAFLAAYFAFKAILVKRLPNLGFLNVEGRFLRKITERFYQYSEEHGSWYLRNDHVQIRGMMKVFYYSILGISAVLMIVSRGFYNAGMLESVYYPVFGIITLGELYFYLDGVTAEEQKRNEIDGMASEAIHNANYSLLRVFFGSLFRDKLLADNSRSYQKQGASMTTEDIIYKYLHSKSAMMNNFAEFLRRKNEEGMTIDQNYVQSSVNLLEGKNILFSNPFYQDLIPYIFYPMNRALLQHRKVLVILGRHGTEEETVKWLEKGIASVTNLPFLWRIGVLSEQNTGENLDIAVLTRSDVLNIHLHRANEEFFADVGFCVILEPSRLISTAQIGLNLFVRHSLNKREHPIVYCLCDCSCEGLVDAISHTLMIDLTEVAAPPTISGDISYMCWETGGDVLHHRMLPNIAQYLGIGTELSMAALRNQVAHTVWYGGEVFPVLDMQWIVRQYYMDLMNYTGLPATQEAMDEHFTVSPNLWDAGVKTNEFITVEDERCNMFEMVRLFMSRTRDQGFVNVISSDYLLKDYMAENASIFETDPKAIPYITADYTRSIRNTILRLLLMMSISPVNEETLKNEFEILQIPVKDLKKQLWYEIYRCYADAESIASLPADKTEAVAEAAKRSLEFEEGKFNISLIVVRERVNMRNSQLEKQYSVTDQKFLRMCIAELRSAGYMAEDESKNRYYLGAELLGHVYQRYLPGQLFTFAGKYYMVESLSADGHILIRRASAHISGRPFYRQIRHYRVNKVAGRSENEHRQTISEMEITHPFLDIAVHTFGYYQMEQYNNFVSAQKVLFTEKNEIPDRVYRSKEAICLRLPMNGYTEEEQNRVRYTITLLLNEIFRTLFGENHVFLSAVTDVSFAEKDSPLTYSFEDTSQNTDRNTIYILEDSQLDLGLLVAFKRNILRIFQIMHDYLTWNKEALEQSTETAGETAEQVKDSSEDIIPRRRPYSMRYYLLYGGDTIPSAICTEKTLEYLSRLGMNEKALYKVRKEKMIAEQLAQKFRPGKPDARYCDFCGAEIHGVEYEKLPDGRDRCMNCSKTAVSSVEEFRQIFQRVSRNMECYYNIKIKPGILVEMVDSQTLHHRMKRSFVPTKQYDSRCIGLAIREHGDKFTLLLENGAPRMQSILTMVHELTHIWQYQNWDEDGIRKKYRKLGGNDLLAEVYEGMAEWVQIQYAYLINETVTANREEIIASMRTDEYGKGFLRYRSNYPISRTTHLGGKTPFIDKETPLGEDYCAELKAEAEEETVTEGETETAPEAGSETSET